MNPFKKYSHEIMLVVFPAILMAYGYHLSQELKTANNKISQLRVELDETSEIAYRDCQVWQQRSKMLNEINGCYKGMEILCGKTNKPATCMDKFNEACQEIE